MSTLSSTSAELLAEGRTLLESLEIPEGAALAATGSFARGELTPYSDYDLLLIHEGPLDEEAVSTIWYPIWDAKKRLDYAVRTPKECVDMLGADISASLALLDLKFVAGNEDVVNRTRDMVFKAWRTIVPKKYNEIADIAISRWRRSGSLVAMTHPNIKHGRGGLRDHELLRALALAHVADAPDLSAERALLLEVRFRLHEQSRRARDVLDPEFAASIARDMGYADRYELSRAIAGAARDIDRALTQAMQQARAMTQRPRLFNRASRKPLDVDVVENLGEITFSRNANFADPGLLVRVAAAAARTGLRVPDSTWNKLKTLPPLLEPWPRNVQSDFIAILASPEHSAQVIEDMDRHGLWERIVPEWGHIRELMPREPSHINTIDIHTINTVVGCASDSVKVARPDLLLLAALYHDMGKGYDRPHSEVGAEMVSQMGLRMGLPTRDRLIVETLVREHTLLARLANQKVDEQVVNEVLDKLHYDVLILDLLEVLTKHDSLATGPGVWTTNTEASVRYIAAKVRERLVRTQPEAPRIHMPGDLAIEKTGEDSARIFWAGTGRQAFTRMLAVLAAKEWKIMSLQVDQHMNVQFDVRASMHTRFDEQNFIQNFKSGVYKEPPACGAANTATYWFSDKVIEIRTVDRRGAMAALLKVLPELEWANVYNPGDTMVGQFAFATAVDRAAVEKAVMSALAPN
ncbi:MAG: [protein-PII] uridylyltransferase [Corynebacterium sp.]|nr:[protein-PII] uridylyltransferase [Corynebacterium sp.]